VCDFVTYWQYGYIVIRFTMLIVLTLYALGDFTRILVLTYNDFERKSVVNEM